MACSVLVGAPITAGRWCPAALSTPRGESPTGDITHKGVVSHQVVGCRRCRAHPVRHFYPNIDSVTAVGVVVVS